MSNEVKKKHGPGAFVLAGISFIPLIGVITGAICVINALISRRPNSMLLGILGCCGVMLTFIIYGVILPNMFKGTNFSKEFEPHAISSMTSLVRHIEYFKLQNGEYPKSIDEVRANLKEGEMVLTHDVSGPMTMGETPRDFFYEVINGGNNYLLFGVGIDNTPFTQDDIYPLIDPSKDKIVGWVKTKPQL